jgi:hypothetical protein
MPDLTRDYLLKIREIEAVTGPFQCLGSAKFLTLKLVGAVDASKKLYDFVGSEWAKQNQDKNPINCWGWYINVYTPEFNRSVLPAACNDPKAGVKKDGDITWSIEFQYFSGNAAQGDELLRKHIPLVVGVEFHNLPGRGHFITIVRDYKDQVWAIDPWHKDADKPYVITLPSKFSFTTATLVQMAGASRIPSSTPWFGYYRNSKSSEPFPLQL